MLTACLAVASRAVEAQSSRTPHVIVVAGTSMYGSDTAVGVPGGRFVGAGAEMPLSPLIRVRALAERTFIWVTADDAGYDGCPDPLLPNSLTNLEVEAELRPLPPIPVGLVVGTGVTWPDPGRKDRRGARIEAPAPGPRKLYRARLDLALGHSPRAPRLQFTKTWYAPKIFALQRTYAGSVVLTF